MMLSQIVIPEAILVGNPVYNLLKSWLPDKKIGDNNKNLQIYQKYFNNW